MTKKTPALSKRLNHIRVTVWPNLTEKKSKSSGEKTVEKWFSTEIRRRYHDGQEWNDSYSLNGVADITLAIEALTIARDFILSQEPAVDYAGGTSDE
jgi:hypothetical protein